MKEFGYHMDNVITNSTYQYNQTYIKCTLNSSETRYRCRMVSIRYSGGDTVATSSGKGDSGDPRLAS